MDTQKARLACKQYLEIGHCRAGDDLLIVFDECKHDLADVLAATARGMGANPYLLIVPTPSDGTYAPWISEFLRGVAKDQFVFVLMSHAMSKWTRAVIGRPDQGLELSPRFFSDWARPTDSWIRTESADPAETEEYGTALLAAMSKGRSVRVTTELGTDLQLQARGWRSSGGEIYTAPIETSAEGIVIYDASIAWGRPSNPIKVTVRGGRLEKIESLRPDLPAADQYESHFEKRTRDSGASVVAELGIGINPQADPFGDFPEAEQARCTCHVEFGMNIGLGGSNRSSVHFGGAVYQPTIYVDDVMVIDKGSLVR